MSGGGPAYMEYFPYAEPYDRQREAMATIADAVDDGRDVLFEGACGTGKTLAALVPALEHARRTDRTVLITTNVHQQMRQFVDDARAIADQEPITAVVFRGKSSMCHIDVDYKECQTLRDATRDVVDAEGDVAELQHREQELLERASEGDDEAAAARADLLGTLEDREDALATMREERATCDHYYANLTRDTTDFFAWLEADVRTPEDVYEYADRQGLCGYELLKEGLADVDLVVCNYRHVLDPTIREQLFTWLDRDPDEVLAVFDEAHNVASAARENARRRLTETTLTRALGELDEVDDTRAGPAYNVIETFRDAMRATYDKGTSAGERGRLDEEWSDLSVANDDGRDDLTIGFLQRYDGQGFHRDLEEAADLAAALEKRYAEAYAAGETATRTECPTRQAVDFLDAWFSAGEDGTVHPVVSVRRRPDRGPDQGGDEASGSTGQRAGSPDGSGPDGRDAGGAGNADVAGNTGVTGDGGKVASTDDGERDVYGRAELYTAIPSAVTGSLFSDLRATVLMSATLQPFDVTSDVLGLEDPVEMAYGPQFPEKRRGTYVVDGPSLFASRREDDDVQATVTESLRQVVATTPGNTLAFFPSYAEARRYHDRLSSQVDGSTYLDEPGQQARDLRERFVADDDAVLCTSLWGTLGEGVSFDGDDARSVVVVGVPYPSLDDRLEAVQAAYDATFDGKDAGWRYAVAVPTIRKVRQAMGRVVRSPEDFGARVLLDGRYTERATIESPEYAVRGQFPADQRSEMVDVDPDKIGYSLLNFFQGVDAYDGTPPTP